MPAGARRQLRAPGLLLKVPGGHGVQGVYPVVENVPGLHNSGKNCAVASADSSETVGAASPRTAASIRDGMRTTVANSTMAKLINRRREL